MKKSLESLEEEVSLEPQKEDLGAVFLDGNGKEYTPLMRTKLLGEKVVFVKFIESKRNGYIIASEATYHQCILRREYH